MANVLAANIDDAVRTLESLRTLEVDLHRAAQAVTVALTAGHKLLACGNGGSAADAAHLTTEFVCRYHRDRKPYPAIALTTHGGDLTAIANDYHFHHAFARQVHAFAKPGDILVAFTTSGQSENIRRALLAARETGAQSIAFLGRDGGNCLGLADIELLVPGQLSARIQEAHKLLLHTLCELADQTLAPPDNPATA
jgi:phosphoheptose isomerase